MKLLNFLRLNQRRALRFGGNVAIFKMVMVKIPPGVGHAITNTGSDLMLLLVYVNEVFDPKDPDTVPWGEL